MKNHTSSKEFSDEFNPISLRVSWKRNLKNYKIRIEIGKKYIQYITHQSR